jgi:molecular chaperone DnaK (HSP70)
MILQKIKADVEAKLGEKITEAIITVPAYFNDAQRKATKDAGAIAGLDVKRIINEPTAAALAYGFNTRKMKRLSSTTSEEEHLTCLSSKYHNDVIEVKSTDGDSLMGGRDIDQKIITGLPKNLKSKAVSMYQKTHSHYSVSMKQLKKQRLNSLLLLKLKSIFHLSLLLMQRTTALLLKMTQKQS